MAQRLALVRRDRTHGSNIVVRRQDRPLGNKLQELAERSPRDLDAIEAITDYVLERLDARDRQRF